MDSRKIPMVAVIATIAVLATGGALASCSSPQGNATAPATSATADPDDVMFAQMMIPHHSQAVQMADQALTRQDLSPEFRTLVEGIKAAQDPEIVVMTGWLKDWGLSETIADSADLSHAHHMDGMQSEEDLAEAEKLTGADYERQWMTMMIDHHEGAISMAEAVRYSKNPDVAELAAAIIAAQESEIALMQSRI